MLFTNSTEDKHQLKGTAMFIKEQPSRRNLLQASRILDFDFAKPMAYVDGVNLYQFDDSDPVDLVDPLGLDSNKLGGAPGSGVVAGNGDPVGGITVEDGSGGETVNSQDLGGYTITLRRPDGNLTLYGATYKGDKYDYIPNLPPILTIKPKNYYAIDVAPPKDKTCSDCGIVMIASVSIKDGANKVMSGTIDTVDGQQQLSDAQGTHSWIDVNQGAKVPYFATPVTKKDGSPLLVPRILEPDGQTYYDGPTAAVGFAEKQGNGTYTATYSFRFYLVCGGKVVADGKGISFDVTQTIVVKDGVGTPTSTPGKLSTFPNMSDGDKGLITNYKP
jgi:hypothetical protein